MSDGPSTFDGDEDPGLRIGELARRSGLSVRALHHYDEIGLLTPSWRTWGDHRLYSRDDARRLLAIQHLKQLGLGLGEVSAALDDPGYDAEATLEAHIAQVRARIADENLLLRRLEGLRGAAAVGWDEVLEVVALTERLHHPDAWVRVRAALDGGAQLPLEELVAGLASDPDPSARETMTWALARHGRAATQAVLDQLDDPDPEVRLQMAHVLSKLDDPAALDGLVGLLQDPDERVVAKAAFALGHLAPEQRGFRHGATGRSAQDAAAPDGRGQAGQSGSDPTQDKVVAALAGVLGEGDLATRDTVSAALARHGSRALPWLTRALAGPAPVRAQAAEVMGLVGDPASVTPLRALAGDPDAEVRFSALVALGMMLDHPGADAAVEEFSRLPDNRTRALALRLLGRDAP